MAIPGNNNDLPRPETRDSLTVSIEEGGGYITFCYTRISGNINKPISQQDWIKTEMLQSGALLGAARIMQ